MSKTIKQIADEIGITKQALQKRMSREPLLTCLSPYICIQQGTKYIDEIGESLIKTAFKHQPQKNLSIDISANTPIDKSECVYSDVVALLKENLKILQEQLAEKDKQIADLTEAVKSQAQSINADRHTELAEILQQKLIETNETQPFTSQKKKQNWFNRTFGKGKSNND